MNTIEKENEMNDIINFVEREDIRIISDEEGEFWFCAMDVCKVLGYPRFNINLINSVPDEWKGIKRINTLGGEQDLWFLHELGLNFFLSRSDKPAALPYQKRLAVVVRDLRKYGFHIDTEQYFTTLPPEQSIQNAQIQLNLLRATFPLSAITDTGVLRVSPIGTKPNPNGDEEMLFRRALNPLNMPSIVVKDKARGNPICIVFAWLNRHKHDKAMAQALYATLGAACAGKKSMSGGDYGDKSAKPFELAGDNEEIYGFNTLSEAQTLAERLRQLVLDTVPLVA